MAKQCTKCGNTKEYTQFSKCNRNKDGLQYHCKECNNRDNQRFRDELDPEYMSRWFSEHRKHWNDYYKIYCASGNINTIYTFTNPKGEVYVGLTRRKRPVFRFGEHKKQYQHRNGLFPLLHMSMDKFGYDKHTIEIIHQSEGTKYEGRILESEFIALYKSKGISLNILN
jgi:hypothetical protein